MSEVARIEGRVRYCSFKKTVKVMITPTDSIDDLKTQLNTYFEHLGENQYTRHLSALMPMIDLGEDRDEFAWKTASYMPFGLLKTIATSDLCLGIWWKIMYYIYMFVPYAIVMNVSRDLI